MRVCDQIRAHSLRSPTVYSRHVPQTTYSGYDYYYIVSLRVAQREEKSHLKRVLSIAEFVYAIVVHLIDIPGSIRSARKRTMQVEDPFYVHSPTAYSGRVLQPTYSGCEY